MKTLTVFFTCLVLPVSLLLTGCDALNRIDSPEDRINTAVPLSGEMQQAHGRMVESLNVRTTDLASFERAWSARLRARALTCSPDFLPSWRHSETEVRSGVKNRSCFEEFDLRLARWMGAQRVRALLSLPPISVGNAPPSITMQSERVSLVQDTGQAPVAALRSTDSLELIALDSGRSMFKERGAYSEVSVSPNGRLFAQTASGVARIRSSDGGETLLQLQDASSIHWLSTWFIGVRRANNRHMHLLSLRTAEEAAIRTSSPSSTEVLLPSPDNSNRFNALNLLGMYQYEVTEQDGKLEAMLVTEKPSADRRFMAAGMWNGQLSADGSEWVTSDQSKLLRIDLRTLEVQENSFDPVSVRSATPTSTPEIFVVDLNMRSAAGWQSSRNGNYLFNASQGTLARVDGAATQRRVQYFAAINRLVHINHPTLWFSERLATGEPVPAAEVVAAMLDETNQQTLRQIDTEEQPNSQSTALSTDSPLAHLVRNAQVEGIGVYEAREKIAQPGQLRGTGRVLVNVRRSGRPVVLVLSSYESVQWNIKLEPGAKLAAVLVGGYYDSTVLGAGEARVMKIGRMSAHSQEGPDFLALQREVARWVGKPISLFQSGYYGSTYSVGGP
ncbi:hypothetical protein [Paucibacter sp. DJ2R-2]|uniref:hypothetical protein n=1 Tax=Paucibacter sp. DJ2R-2 TaxID=2893558 RepID=UPI0021E36157|nr:hypothetical protein [Paucibacter sp. DJ2R-2]MCV2438712.1 hypothetical protein [Paucibacter sp. DJ2R-2]